MDAISDEEIGLSRSNQGDFDSKCEIDENPKKRLGRRVEMKHKKSVVNENDGDPIIKSVSKCTHQRK